jgi:hypothetical protein
MGQRSLGCVEGVRLMDRRTIRSQRIKAMKPRRIVREVAARDSNSAIGPESPPPKEVPCRSVAAIRHRRTPCVWPFAGSPP